jgi:hypothetical protein
MAQCWVGEPEATMLWTRLSTFAVFTGEERMVRRNTISSVGIRLIFTMAVFLLASFNVWAQTTGTILGEIFDQSGALIPSATVQATNTDTGFTVTEKHMRKEGVQKSK